MKKFFFVLFFSFIILFLINLLWIVFNLYMFVVHGIQSIIEGQTLVESIYYSTYLRWILLGDIFWVISLISYIFTRKSYKSTSDLHFLRYEPIETPKICIIIPTFNEEKSIESVIQDYKKQRFVQSVIVIDNNSDDKTVEISKKNGAIVIEKNENKGYSHSLVLGLNEALKTDANIIGTTEADGTFNAYDLQKMLPYLDNCDLVIGSRQNQVITEKDNQNTGFFVWANFILAKLIQIKYLSLSHMGIVSLTDVGCVYRIIKRDALEKVIKMLTYPESDKPIGGIGIGLYLTMVSIEKDLKIIEVPVTFKKRIGISKIQSGKFTKMIKIGLSFLWLILIT